MLSTKKILSLISVNFIYALEPIVAKYTSNQEFLSIPFVLGLCGVVGILGLYAILWQQILKRIDLSTAYMFKGSSLIFVLLLSVCLLGDKITGCNIIGSAMIIIGIIVFAK